LLITKDVKSELKAKKIRKLYIVESEEENYQQYLDSVIGQVLTQKDGSLEDKASALTDHSVNKLKGAYENLDNNTMAEVGEVSKNIQVFLNATGEDGLSELLNLEIDNSIQKHALNVSTISGKLFEMIFIMEQDKDKKKLIQPLLKMIDNNKNTYEIITMAGLLHDVGRKEGAEDILHEHGEKGSEQVTNISDSANHKKVAEIIVQHEEFCDGSGFPNQLKKAQMSLHSQIVSLANYFDNLIYIENKSKEEALQILEDNEKKFNKNLISVLKEII
jgi:HD-GYP domain-containing protein (c-di-GMP phosphodiesterase class II)